MPSGRLTRSAPTSGSAAASGGARRGPGRVRAGTGSQRRGVPAPSWRGARPGHTLENAAADAIELTEEDLALISRDFPAPSHKMPLDME